jgi:hypothetical protein
MLFFFLPLGTASKRMTPPRDCPKTGWRTPLSRPASSLVRIRNSGFGILKDGAQERVADNHYCSIPSPRVRAQKATLIRKGHFGSHPHRLSGCGPPTQIETAALDCSERSGVVVTLISISSE